MDNELKIMNALYKRWKQLIDKGEKGDDAKYIYLLHDILSDAQLSEDEALLSLSKLNAKRWIQWDREAIALTDLGLNKCFEVIDDSPKGKLGFLN